MNARRDTLRTRVLLVALGAFCVLHMLAACQPAAPEPQAPPVAATLPDITRLAQHAGPAVVNISTERMVGGGGLRDFFQYHAGPGSPFEEFFRQLEPLFPGSRPRTQRSLGSGFIIDPDGLVVTNAHVVEASDRISVILQDNAEESFEAELVGVDKATDVALLRIRTGHKLPALSFGDSGKLLVGEWVVAIGNPFGLDHTVTIGIVSAKGRAIEGGGDVRYLQTDASINPGNSGGPLINLHGRVVGVNTAMVATGQGIGFAIPSDTARQAIQRIKAGLRHSAAAPPQTAAGGGLGLRTQDMDAATARALGLRNVTGVLVTSVEPGSAADRAGIRRSDAILELQGRAVPDSASLEAMVRQLPPGDRVTLTVYRRGRLYSVSFPLAAR